MSGPILNRAKAVSALAAVCAMVAVAVAPATAQTARNLVCRGCVDSKDIKNKGVKAGDLAPGLVLGTTILVRANEAPAANCARLRAALSKLKAGPKAPGLVRLETGTYDCGAAPLVLKPFVSVEGTGPGGTTIIGSPSNNTGEVGVIEGAAGSALLGLTVVHRALGSARAIGIRTGAGHMSLRDIVVRVATSTSADIRGIVAVGTSLDLSNVGVEAISTNGGAQGIDASSGANLTMLSVWIDNAAVAGNPAALQLFDSKVKAYGIMFNSNIFGIIGFGNSTFEIRGGTIVGGRGVGGGFTGSFSCVGVAKGDFSAALAANCT